MVADRGFAAIELLDRAVVAHARGDVDDYSDQYQARSHGQRKARGLDSEVRPRRRQFLQEQPEPCDHKTETHQRETGANPGEIGSLCCKVDPRVAPEPLRQYSRFRRLLGHLAVRPPQLAVKNTSFDTAAESRDSSPRAFLCASGKL